MDWQLYVVTSCWLITIVRGGGGGDPEYAPRKDFTVGPSKLISFLNTYTDGL